MHGLEKNRKRRGNTLVESSLVLLVFLAMLIAIVDFGQVLFFHQSLVERVRAGLRWGTVRSYDANAIKNYICFNSATAPANGGTGFLGLTNSNITVSHTDAGTNTERIQVAIVDYNFYLFSPWIAKVFTNNMAVVESLPVEYRP
jgi:Flp pilus assembly protein TadG